MKARHQFDGLTQLISDKNKNIQTFTLKVGEKNTEKREFWRIRKPNKLKATQPHKKIRKKNLQNGNWNHFSLIT
jgi:hypothetical protein